MAFVLQVVKHGDLRAAAKDGRGEAGVEEDVEAAAGGGQGQQGLLPEQARRTVDGAHRLRHVGEVSLRGDQVGAGFAIGEDEVVVVAVDFSQCGQKRPQVDFGAADAARNQVERVHADAHVQRPLRRCWAMASPCRAAVQRGVERQRVLEFGDGGGGLVGRQAHLPLVHVGDGEVGVELLRGIEGLHRLRPLGALRVDIADLRVDVRRGFHGGGLAELLQRLFGLIQTVVGESPIDQQVRCGRLELAVFWNSATARSFRPCSW